MIVSPGHPKTKVRLNRWSVQTKICGFSLVELLVATAVLALMSLMMLTVVNSAQRLWKQTSARTEQFREARRAFERITQRLSQATLNPYWDYVDASGFPRTTNNASSFVPARYARMSELRYLHTNAASLTSPRGGTLAGQAVFFQAPEGESASPALARLDSLLNTAGFFLEVGSDVSELPPTMPPSAARTRYRVYELVEPSENFSIYGLTSGNALYDGADWFTGPLAVRGYSRRLADNIVAMLFRADYFDTSGNPTSAFAYSSAPTVGASQPIEANNLPVSVRVTMVAVDENSARRIEEQALTLVDAVDEESLSRLEAQLQDERLTFQKFESTVAIGPAQWRSQ